MRISDWSSDVCSSDLDGGVEGVDMDAVRDLAGHAQHPRVDRGEVDRRVRPGDRSRRPHPGEERELPELPPAVQSVAAEGGERRADGAYVIASSGAGRHELGYGAPFGVGAGLGAPAEDR